MKALVITKSITTREARSIEQYLNDISRYDVLNPDQEFELFKRFRRGDELALEQILTHNLRFVVSVAKQYQNMGLSLNDLINEGNLGLITAARRFDVSRGFKFISYAVWWIRQRILQALNEKGRKIRLPSNQQSSFQKIKKCEERLCQRLNRLPSLEEIANDMNLSVDFVERVIRSGQYSKSLDAPSLEDSDNDMKNYLADEKIAKPDAKLVQTESLKQEVRLLLGYLSQREIAVLTMAFGLDSNHPMGLEDIGKELELSKERVRQIKTRAIRKMRLFVNRHNLTFSLN